MLSQRIKTLMPYVPGEQPRDRRYIKLNTNENPYQPSPRIRDFLRTFDPETLRRYPDPRMTALRQAIGRRFGLSDDCVFTGNGSDEVLAFAFYAFFDSDCGPVLFPTFTYSFYPVYCNFFDIDYRTLPLGGDYTVDLDAFAVAGKSCGAIFPNPNAPTGIGLPLDRVRSLLERFPRDRVVIVDEAYIDFGGQSAASLIDSYNNLLVVQTFSKSMALAGIRLGFAMGAKPLIDALFTAKDAFNSYPVDTLAQQIGVLAMEDRDHFDEICRKIVATRERFGETMTGLGWRLLPSQANFVFASKPGVPGSQIYNDLKAAGILVRYFDKEGLRDFVRITMGTDEEMDTLVEAIQRLFG
ncbi:MAG: histidinol-phosphate transaminase [Desulfobacterales bacterium]|nr:histidinol-phosphate transaminase [Desulfobacterales bacterium]